MESAVLSFMSAYLFLGLLLGYRVAAQFRRRRIPKDSHLPPGYVLLAEIMVFLSMVFFWFPILLRGAWKETGSDD